MLIKDRITKKTNLEENDSLSGFDGELAQQFHEAYEVFYEFLKKVKPKQILEIGTALGGFTNFLTLCLKELGLETTILSYDIYDRPFYSNLRNEGVDVRIENVFDGKYSQVSEEVISFIQKEGTTIVLCDGGNKKGEISVLSPYIKNGDFILGHDYAHDEETFNNIINGKIWNWFELEDKDLEEISEKYELEKFEEKKFESVAWTCRQKIGANVEKPKNLIPYSKKIEIESSKITLVTGIWNIGRNELTEGWARSYQHYLDKFESLLKVENNMIIFGDKELKEFVFQRRSKENTQFILRDLSWFQNNEFFDKIQKIRNNPTWFNQVGWLKESTQAKLENYNPLVMSKMFLLHDAKIVDQFNSDFLFWIDGGLSNTVHSGYFTHDKVLYNLEKYINKFSFVCFPYEAEKEIHGFEYNKLNEVAGSKVKRVARGGFFGGPKESISDINSIYYGLMKSTLNEGFMGTEESIFSIMCYKHSDIINYFDIENNGLIGKFFEDLKNDQLKPKSESSIKSINNLDTSKVALYVITFNSPKQFETLIESMMIYDSDFLNKTEKFLLNNSTDRSTDLIYSQLCDDYGFEEIKKENLGICGGRQFIAEHFQETSNDFMFFFEDDMFFYLGKEDVCKNGFYRHSKNLFQKTLEICKKENFDFLKLNFTEFYGDNATQWSWYNVPQDVRVKFWPEKPKLPEIGLDPSAPRTKFDSIHVHKSIPYVRGEVYYCNWPQIVTKDGNPKMFLDTVWAHPYEQTWMSHMYQLTKKGELSSGLLLLTPTEHNRFEHYDRGLRKES